VQVHHRYDVGPTALFDTLVDPAFLAARSARYGGLGAPAVDHLDSGVHVRSLRQLPLDHVPSALRRFVGDGRVEQVDAWTEVTTDRVVGTWTIDSGRAPIDLHGTHEITADESGSSYVVTAHVRVTLPLAGRLTRQVEAYLAQLVAAEQKFLAEWLTA
jgi:hypothetical protein